MLLGEQLQGPKKAPAAGIQGAGLPASQSLRASELRSGSRPQQSPSRSTCPSFLLPPDSSSWQSCWVSLLERNECGPGSCRPVLSQEEDEHSGISTTGLVLNRRTVCEPKAQVGTPGPSCAVPRACPAPRGGAALASPHLASSWWASAGPSLVLLSMGGLSLRRPVPWTPCMHTLLALCVASEP